jgi:predicted small integral membrane protein
MDVILILVQCALTGGLAGWMITGVVDNWRYPDLNVEAVAMVTRFDLMAAQYPADFAHVKHRRIDDPRKIRALFRLIVLWETLAALLLTLGTGMLAAAAIGLVDVTLARAIAVLGATAFVMNWAGFLIGGNYFCYWYGHFPSQATHLMLAIWGILVLLVLI